MKMKLTKIVYDYGIKDDLVRVVNHYEPCEDDDPNGQLVVDGKPLDDMKSTSAYTSHEWNDILYWIRSNGLAIDVVKAIDEVAR